MSTVETFGQATAWISITIVTTIFQDTFSRVTTAPPFALGTADTGQTWVWNGWDTSYTINTSPTYADGSYLIANFGGNYDDMRLDIPPTIDVGDVYYDFYIPAAGYNHLYVYWEDVNWWAGIYQSSDTVVYLQGNSFTPITISTRDAWYRVHFQVDSSGPGGIYVKGHLWKVGDTEPVTWSTIQTSWPSNYNAGTAYKPVLDIYYTNTIPDKIDNIIVSTSIQFPFNEGWAQAKAAILAVGNGFAQAQAAINQVLQTGQSQADILATYTKYAQSQTFIRKLAGYANAQTKIYPAPGTYAYEVFADGAISYYDMDKFTYGEAFIYDIKGTYNLNHLYPYSNSNWAGKVRPSLKAQQWYYYDTTSNSGASSITTNSIWSVELWIKPNLNNISTYIPIWQIGTTTSYNRITILYGNPTAGNPASAGTSFYVAETSSASGSTYSGGSFPSNAWYHLVLTSNGASRNFYINGVLVNSWSGTQNSGWGGTVNQYTNYDLYWGTKSQYETYRDDWATYLVELTPTQVETHYNLADPVRYGFSQALASINTVWKIGQATMEIGAGPGGWYKYNTFGQATYALLATSRKYAQAKAQIREEGKTRFAQARALIQPINGLVAGIWTGGQSNESTVGSWYAEKDRNQPIYYADGSSILPPGYPGNNSWGMMWGGTFVADETGPWQFKSGTDDGSLIRIQGDSIPGSAVTGNFTISGKIATMNNNYGGGQSYTERSGTVYLTAGNLYTIQAKAGNGSGGWYFRFYFARPNETYFSYLTDGAPWINSPDGTTNDTFVRAYAQAQISAFDVSKFAQAGAYFWPFYFAQARADILRTFQSYGQSRVRVGGFQFAFANALILSKDAYYDTVIADTPLAFWRLNEKELSGPNLVRTPLDGATRTFSTNSGWADQTTMADGDLGSTNQTGADPSNWVRVTWSSPQVVSQINLWDRNNGGGGWDADWWGRGTGGAALPFDITFSDGSVYTIPVGENGYQATTAYFPRKTITWFQVNAPAGQNTYSPGFSEIEAFGTVEYPRIVSYGSDKLNASVLAATGTPTTAPTLLNTAHITTTDSALYFAGGMALIVPNNTATLSPYRLQTGSIEAWIKTTSSSGVQGIVVKQQDYGIFTNSGAIGFYDWGGSGWHTGPAVNDGNVHHVVLTWTMATGATLYLDRQIVATGAINHGGSEYYEGITIADGGITSGQYFVGTIDDISLYNYELNSTKINTHFYAAGFLSYEAFSQAQSQILGKPRVHAQAQAILLAFDYPRHAQATADILQTTFKHAQAQVVVFTVAQHAQGTADILQTYPTPSFGTGSAILRPVSDLFTTTPVTYSSGTTGWNLVDEAVLDTADWYQLGVINPTPGAITHGFGAISLPGSAVIINIVVSANVTNGAPAQDGAIRIRRPSTGTFYTIASIGQNPPSQWDTTVTTRPWDSQPWTVADINEIQAGSRNGAPNVGSLRIRQLYITVNYTFPGPFAQAQARVIGAYNRHAQAKTSIKVTSVGHGQAQTIVGRYLRVAQAQARVYSFDYPRFGQANAHISTTAQKFAQAAARIIPPTVFANTQAQIIAFNVSKVGQAQADISATRSVFAQAKIWVIPPSVFAQSAARILSFDYPRHAQARVRILVETYKSGQARVVILQYTTGLAATWVVQTYPHDQMAINYATTGYGASSWASSTLFGTPSGVLDNNDNNYWASNTSDLIGPVHTWILIDLGTGRTINSFFVKSALTSSSFTLQHSDYFYDDANFTNGTVLSADLYSPIGSVGGTFAPITARYWRLLVTDGTPYLGFIVSGINNFQLGTNVTVGPTFAQAQAYLGHVQMGQAQAHISPGRGINFGQALALIVSTRNVFAQTNTWVIPPTVVAQAAADILSTINSVANANTWVIPPTVVGQAAADIFAISTNIGNAATTVLTLNTKRGQAQAHIAKGVGFAQATTEILQYGLNRIGRARVYVGHFQPGQAQTFILIVHTYVMAQAQMYIYRTVIKSGNARAFIDTGRRHANAKVAVNRTYTYSTFALALIDDRFVMAQTQAQILRTFQRFAQAQIDLKNIATNYTNPYGQAMCSVVLQDWPSAQAQAFIVNVKSRSAQAATQIGYFKYAQANTRIIAFNVPKHAAASAYISVDINIPPTGPSSDRQFYLIRYNNYTLPGYAQSESFESPIKIGGK